MIVPRPAHVLALALLAAGTLAPAAASAQQPTRPFRGLFGAGRPPDQNRMRHEVTAVVNALGGYDDNLNPTSIQGGIPQGAGAITSSPLATRPSGYLGSADVEVRYSASKTTRSFNVTGRTFASTFQNISGPPISGSELNASQRFSIGRRNDISFSETVQRMPYFTASFLGPIQATAGVVNAQPALLNAATLGVSTTMGTSASIEREWTRRMRTTVQYGYTNRAHQDPRVFRNVSHGGTATITRTIGRRDHNLHASYGRNDYDLSQMGIVRGIVTNSFQGGGSYQRRLGRRRTMSVTGGGGMQHVNRYDAVVYDYWMPTSYANAVVEIGRSWSATTTYRQSLNVLPAPVFTSNSFLSHALSVGAGGYVHDRLDLTFNVLLSNGTVSGLASSTNASNPGSYRGYTSVAQARVQLNRFWSAIVVFNRYDGRINGIPLSQQPLQTTIPPTTQRNAVSVGFSWGVPLFGYFDSSNPMVGSGRNRP